MKIPLTTVQALQQLAIASPCSASWDQMKGDGRSRFCQDCQQTVYDLTDLSTAEALALVEQQEGRRCVRFYRRKDGTVITADCPVGLRWILWKRLRKRMAWAASLFAVLVLPACGMGMPRRPDVLRDRSLIEPQDVPSQVVPADDQSSQDRSKPIPHER